MEEKMGRQIDLVEVDNKIQLMKKNAEELSRMADQFPALARNMARILASIKMLEINISDIVTNLAF